jgi:hypothetical protein
MSSICQLARVGIGIIAYRTPDRMDRCRLPTFTRGSADDRFNLPSYLD